MGWESFGMVRFDLGPLLQGQMRIAKLKSAYYSLIIGRRGSPGFKYMEPSTRTSTLQIASTNTSTGLKTQVQVL